MAKRYYSMGDVFAAVRNREQSERVDVQNMIPASRIARGFAQAFNCKGPFCVSDKLIAKWIDRLLSSKTFPSEQGDGHPRVT